MRWHKPKIETTRDTSPQKNLLTSKVLLDHSLTKVTIMTTLDPLSLKFPRLLYENLSQINLVFQTLALVQMNLLQERTKKIPKIFQSLK